MHALVLGIDGAIGGALAVTLVRRGWRVTGTSRRGGPAAADCERLPLDLADPAGWPALPRADAVFLCAAMTRQAACRDEPALAARVNRDAPLRLADKAAEGGGRLLFLSSSAVFDGRVPNRDADDPTCPLNEYGRLKAGAEAGVLARPGGTVVRLTKVLHAGLPLFRGWLDALRGGGTVRAFADLTMAPIALADAVDGLARIGESGETGLFQLSAARDISYLDAAHHLARRLEVPAGRVEAAAAAGAGIPDSDRPAATSLDTSRFARLFDSPPPDPFDVIDRVFGSLSEPDAG